MDCFKIIVFPEYCGGCVQRNFKIIHQESTNNSFKLYFDSTDRFVLNEAKRYNLNYEHIDRKSIYIKFGDYANLVVRKQNGETIELQTNQVIQKGVHY